MLAWLNAVYLWLFTGWVEEDPADDVIRRMPKYWTEKGD
jgi:hypothetical protein